MMIWQYKIVRNMLADSLENALNALGADGWEVVSLAGIDGTWTLTGNKLYAMLKRPALYELGDEDRNGIADEVESLLERDDVAAAMDAFLSDVSAHTFVELCTVFGSVAVAEGDAGVLRSLPSATKSLLLALGLRGDWTPAGVRSIIDRHVDGPTDYVEASGVDKLKRVGAPAEWSSRESLQHRYSNDVLDKAWEEAASSLLSSDLDAMEELCARIVEGADPNKAWANILGGRG